MDLQFSLCFYCALRGINYLQIGAVENSFIAQAVRENLTAGALDKFHTDRWWTGV